MDYVGNDLKQVKTSSADMCACRCKEYDGCRFFSWHSDGSQVAETCFLKSSDGDRIIREDYVYVGSRDCCTGDYYNHTESFEANN